MSHINSQYGNCKRSAKARGKDFDIDKRAFNQKVTKPCFYCGTSSPAQKRGLDRIDSGKGYSDENTVPCCRTCNIMKNDLDMESFFEHIAKIASHLNI